MPNYQEGKIYKIYNTINDDIYVGSTTVKLCERMRQHRYHNRASMNYLLYKTFREYGVENFFIELIEKCPCNDKDELRKAEGNYIRLLKPSLNKRIEGRNKTEYYQDNRDIIAQKMKEYRENNRGKLLQKQRDNYQQNREVRIVNNQKYRNEHKEERREYDKQYRENNRVKILQQHKEYNEVNKERDAILKAEKIKCECGCIVSRGNLAPHRRTKKHEQLLQTMD
uniref:GIY-YIG nuclease family protein n=1 Tax=Flavobacterium sp. TaxID=239 RepID=UPI00404B8C07